MASAAAQSTTRRLSQIALLKSLLWAFEKPKHKNKNCSASLYSLHNLYGGGCECFGTH